MCEMNFVYNNIYDIRCDVYGYFVLWIDDLYLFCGMFCILNMINV